MTVTVYVVCEGEVDHGQSPVAVRADLAAAMRYVFETWPQAEQLGVGGDSDRWYQLAPNNPAVAVIRSFPLEISSDDY